MSHALPGILHHVMQPQRWVYALSIITHRTHDQRFPTHRTLWRWRPALWRGWATVRLLPHAALGWLCAVLAVVTLLLCIAYGMPRCLSPLPRQLSPPIAA